MRVLNSAGTRLCAFIRRRQAARLLRSASRPAMPCAGGAIDEGTLEEVGVGGSFGRHVSEADLHAYIDDALDPAERMQVEAFLADHDRIAARVEAYRAQVVSMSAAFRAGEAPLPPDVAQLAACYARAVARTSWIGVALGLVGLVAVLCMISEAALGAAG